MRLNMKDFLSAKRNETNVDIPKPVDLDGQEPDTIYYLKATRHDPDDVMLMGPMSRFTEILKWTRNVMRRLDSHNGLSTLEEIVNSPGFGARSLESLNAPLTNQTTMRFDIVRENNPEVFRVLPKRKTFTVTRATASMGPEGWVPGAEDHLDVHDNEVLRIFTSTDGALDFARTKFAELQANDDVPIVPVHTLPLHNGLIPGSELGPIGILERAPTDGQPYLQFVEVQYIGYPG